MCVYASVYARSVPLVIESVGKKEQKQPFFFLSTLTFVSTCVRVYRSTTILLIRIIVLYYALCLNKKEMHEERFHN